MARPNQATKAKRDRERQRQDRQKEKEEKRLQRVSLKKDREKLTASGVDPDLEGIVPGPQPLALD